MRWKPPPFFTKTPEFSGRKKMIRFNKGCTEKMIELIGRTTTRDMVRKIGVGQKPQALCKHTEEDKEWPKETVV